MDFEHMMRRTMAELVGPTETQLVDAIAKHAQITLDEADLRMADELFDDLEKGIEAFFMKEKDKTETYEERIRFVVVKAVMFTLATKWLSCVPTKEIKQVLPCMPGTN